MLDAWFNPATTTVPAIDRDTAAQAEADAATANLALYHYDSCMYCARVRKAIAALSLNVELRDIMGNREHYRDLATHGGRTTVPCLRIGKDDPAGEWMFESADIIAYLVGRFGTTAPT